MRNLLYFRPLWYDPRCFNLFGQTITQSKLRFSGDIKDYRQPMVTSLGIILGFLLNFLASWSAESDAEAAIQTPSDWLIVSSLLISLLGMLWVLYRVLDNRLDSSDSASEQVARYYQTTFKLYIASVSLAFFGVIISLFL